MYGSAGTSGWGKIGEIDTASGCELPRVDFTFVYGTFHVILTPSSPFGLSSPPPRTSLV
uniref:Uncharacterized protein n=1 Tax=Fagus sylvatica TaxID=28930 RepID=A0A2N9J4G1_FAGSY